MQKTGFLLIYKRDLILLKNTYKALEKTNTPIIVIDNSPTESDLSFMTRNNSFLFQRFPGEPEITKSFGLDFAFNELKLNKIYIIWTQ